MKMENLDYYHDWETGNVSFVNLANDLKAEGIENHAFMLRLANSQLKNVDPHSDNLSEVEQMLIMEECMVNPWYFLREVVGLNTTERMELNKGTLASAYLMTKGISNHLIMDSGRQKTFTQIVTLIHREIFWDMEARIISSNPDDIIHAIAVIHDNLPDYMKHDDFRERVNVIGEPQTLSELEELIVSDFIGLTLFDRDNDLSRALDIVRDGRGNLTNMFGNMTLFNSDFSGDRPYGDSPKRWENSYYDLDDNIILSIVDHSDPTDVVYVEFDNRELDQYSEGDKVYRRPSPSGEMEVVAKRVSLGHGVEVLLYGSDERKNKYMYVGVTVSTEQIGVVVVDPSDNKVILECSVSDYKNIDEAVMVLEYIQREITNRFRLVIPRNSFNLVLAETITKKGLLEKGNITYTNPSITKREQAKMFNILSHKMEYTPSHIGEGILLDSVMSIRREGGTPTLVIGKHSEMLMAFLLTHMTMTKDMMKHED